MMLNQRHRAILFLLSVLILPPGRVYAEDAIALLQIHNERSRVWKDYHLRAFEKFGVLERVGLGYWNKPRSKYSNEQTRKGYVSTVTRSGQIYHSLFRTMPDKEVFETYLSDQVERLNSMMPDGQSANVESSGDWYSIQNDEFTHEDGSISLKWELNVRYVDGVLASARGPGTLPSLRRIPVKQIAKALPSAKGKMWYLEYRPQNVPENSRLAVIELIGKAAGVGLQQRDAESDGDYETRRLMQDAQLRLVRSFVSDIDSLKAWTAWPTDDEKKPFRAHVALVALPNSPLAGMLKQLRRRTDPVKLDSGDLGHLRFCMSVPKSLRAPLKALTQRVAGTMAGSVTDEALERGLNAAARFNIHQDGAIGVRGLTTVKLPSLSGELTPPRQGGVQFSTLRYETREVTGGSAFTIAASSAAQDVDAERVDRLREDVPRSLIDLEFDFGPCIRSDKDSQARKLLEKIETAYIRTRWKGPMIGFKKWRQVVVDSIAQRVEAGEDADWTISAKLRSRGRSLTLDLVVGRDLHEFWCVRQRVAPKNGGM